MNTRTILVDGLSLTLEDQAAAIIERFSATTAKALADSTSQIAVLTTQLASAKTANDAAIADAKKANDAQTAEIATLKQQLADAKITPAALDALVNERADVFGKAKAILGDSYNFTGKSITDVRRDAVRAKLGDAMSAWTDDMCTASFGTLTAGMKAGGGNASSMIAQDFSNVQTFRQNSPEAATAAYDEYNKKLTGAYKTPVQ